MININHQKKGGLWFGVAFENDIVFATSFSRDEEKTLKTILSSLPLNKHFQLTEKQTEFSSTVMETMSKVCEGEDVPSTFNFHLDPFPSFTMKVLRCVHMIPVGYVTSYGEVAKAVHVPHASRAVGNVMARNPFAPLIPCHRVVRSNFKLGGYGGGLDLKMEILSKEDRGYQSPLLLNLQDGPFHVFPISFLKL